jgi:hypothetical protein
MRREGAYSSSLATWRGQYAAGELAGSDSKRRASKCDSAGAELKQLALVTRERDKLRVQLGNAKLVIEVQKKLPRCWSNSSRFRSSRVIDGWHACSDPRAWVGCCLARHGAL